ncbi:hypothetical protein BH23PSE1_BH23PSE1_07790 [soil metagenome]
MVDLCTHCVALIASPLALVAIGCIAVRLHGPGSHGLPA